MGDKAGAGTQMGDAPHGSESVGSSVQRGDFRVTFKLRLEDGMDQVHRGEEERGAWRQCVWEPRREQEPCLPGTGSLAPGLAQCEQSERMCPQELQKFV